MSGPGNVEARVYVHNLPYRFSWQDLKDHFQAAGTIVWADIMMTPQRRSKGCGLVEFSSPEEAQNAIATLNDTEIDGRKILVREDREKEGAPKRERAPAPAGQTAQAASDLEGRQVFVNNLDKSITWKELKNAFSPAGVVVRADIIGDENGLSKGQGLILFETAEAAQKAIQDFHEGELKDKVITVKMDTKVGAFGRFPKDGGRAPSTSTRAPRPARAPRSENQGPAEVSKRVYVHNLPYSVTWQDLKDHFRQAGNIVFADVMRNNQGRSKGCGIVEFSSEEEAAEAIATMNDTELVGRNILVREDRENNKRPAKDAEAVEA